MWTLEREKQFGHTNIQNSRHMENKGNMGDT